MNRVDAVIRQVDFFFDGFLAGEDGGAVRAGAVVAGGVAVD